MSSIGKREIKQVSFVKFEILIYTFTGYFYLYLNNIFDDQIHAEILTMLKPNYTLDQIIEKDNILFSDILIKILNN